VQFSAQIFKTQANLDPKHRDRISYLRIVSGVYEKGMKVKHSRTKGNKMYLASEAFEHPQGQPHGTFDHPVGATTK